MDLISNTGGNPELVARLNQIQNQQAVDEQKWVSALRKAGFKAAHPDDAWVERATNEVHFAYPQFNDGVAVGDLVMLGWPLSQSSWRPVRVIGSRTAPFTGVWWKFEDAPGTFPL